jgi:hypothetical protein
VRSLHDAAAAASEPRSWTSSVKDVARPFVRPIRDAVRRLDRVGHAT